MDVNQFIISLNEPKPPSALGSILEALWWDGKGDWAQAHEIAQEISDNNGSWIHAYLHRKEGDIWNADYWYRMAGRKRPETGLEQEWKDIVTHFLKA